MDWNPSNKPYGAKSVTLATGESNTTAFRDDLLVSLALPAIPNTSMSTMLRLQMHLKGGGTVTLTTEDETIPTFSVDLKLAPGADVQIRLSDSEMLEYTFSTVLRAPGMGGTHIGATGGLLAFAVCGETPDVFIYNRSGGLLAKYESGADPDQTQIINLCATRGETFWAAMETNGDGFSVLVEIGSDGTPNAPVSLDRLIGDPFLARKSLLELEPGQLLSVDRSSRELIQIAGSSGAITRTFALTFDDGYMDAAINDAGTHIIYTTGTQLRLYDLAADDGVGTLIKDFGYSVAWPVWLEDGTIIVNRGIIQDTTSNAKFTVGRVYGTDPVTSGTFTLTYPPTTGSTTTPIAYNANGAAIEAALALLPTIGTGNIQVTDPAATLNSGLFIEFQFVNGLGGAVHAPPSINNSTDGTLEVNDEGGGSSLAPFDDAVGFFGHGDFVRVSMAGKVIKVYKYRRRSFHDNEGVVGYAASTTLNRIWIYGELDDSRVSEENSSLVILNLMTGQTFKTIRILNDWSYAGEFFDSDTSAAVTAPYFSGWAA